MILSKILLAVKKNKHIMYLLITTFLSMAISMLNTIIIARFLGANGRGTIQLILTAQGLLATACSFGLGVSYIYNLKKKCIDIGLIDIILKVILFSIISSIIFIYTQDINDFLYPIIFIVLTTSISFTLLDIMKVEKDLLGYRYATLIPILLNFTLNIFLIFLDKFNISSSINTLLFSQLIQTIYIVYYCNKKIKIVKFKFYKFIKIFTYKETKYYVFILGFTIVVTSISNHIDKLVVYNILGLYELGKLSIIISLCAILNKIFDILSTSYFSHRLQKNNKPENIVKLFLLMILLYFFISPLIYLIGNKFIPVIFGSEFIDLGGILVIMLLNSIVNGFNSIIAQEFNIQGKPLFTLIRVSLSILLFIFLAYIFADFMLIGITISILLSSIFRLALSLTFLRKL